MSSILIIDDDASLSELLGEYLREHGFLVYTAGDGQKGLRVFFEQRPDLVILDVSMPKMDGWETLKPLREVSDAPVIMLTARDEEPNVLRGFSLGADDYVTKPFSFAQLAARIKAVLMRSKGGAAATEQLEAGGLRVDLATRRVTRDGEPISLSNRVQTINGAHAPCRGSRFCGGSGTRSLGATVCQRDRICSPLYLALTAKSRKRPTKSPLHP